MMMEEAMMNFIERVCRFTSEKKGMFDDMMM